MSKTLKLIALIICSVFAGAVIGYIYGLPKHTDNGKPIISTVTISGKPVVIEKVETSGIDIITTVSSSGEGVTEIIIPKTTIPEARYWIEKVNGVSVVAGYDLARESYFQCMYWRRFGVFSIGAGVSARIGDRIEPGALAGVSYWF